VGLIIAGYEVNHCHIHLIPTQTMADVDFSNAATSVTREELETHSAAIIKALSLVE
jgi:histidine triad (HIT) family protein